MHSLKNNIRKRRKTPNGWHNSENRAPEVIHGWNVHRKEKHGRFSGGSHPEGLRSH